MNEIFEDSARRYDVDWLRVIAIAILLFYHAAIFFQPWARLLGFIQSEQTMDALWMVAAIFNTWRIPLLFLVSGMGVFLAMKKRSWSQLLGERSRRILLPFLFGSACIVPLNFLLFQDYYGEKLAWFPHPHHLWFLGHIYFYVLLSLPLLLFLRSRAGERALSRVREALSSCCGVYLFLIPCVLEAHLLDPEYYTFYAMSAHGLWLGMIFFLYGFLFLCLGKPLHENIIRLRYANLTLAFLLYGVRLLYFELEPPHILSSLETYIWILAVLGLAARHLNRPSPALSYLARVAYPVYILHMSFLMLSAYFVLPLAIPAPLQFLLVAGAGYAGSFALCYLVIERVALLRPLFGLKNRESPTSGQVAR